MYRCLICQKPFVSFKAIAVSDDVYGEYSIEVTPCCESFSYSHLTGNSLTRVYGGSAMCFSAIGEDEQKEIALNWAIDFQKDNKE